MELVVVVAAVVVVVVESASSERLEGHRIDEWERAIEEEKVAKQWKCLLLLCGCDGGVGVVGGNYYYFVVTLAEGSINVVKLEEISLQGRMANNGKETGDGPTVLTTIYISFINFLHHVYKS